jgi:N-methylhydantoinase A/oxoprolinase/acetone carboxylase beta subunit
MKLVSRGDTTVVDAYLSPHPAPLRRQVAAQMPGVRLFFMQSSGGLTEAHRFQGKDAILSGPAGGIVGMVRTAVAAGTTRSSASTWAAPAPTSATTPASSSAPSRPRWPACACARR